MIEEAQHAGHVANILIQLEAFSDSVSTVGVDHVDLDVRVKLAILSQTSSSDIRLAHFVMDIERGRTANDNRRSS